MASTPRYTLAPTTGSPTSAMLRSWLSNSVVSGRIRWLISSPSTAAIFKPSRPRSRATFTASSAAVGTLATPMFVTMRVPYPLGFYTKWMDGRIDDPAAGWKGRGVWATVSTRAPFHMETGKGTTSKVMKFQVRPNPLAR